MKKVTKPGTSRQPKGSDTVALALKIPRSLVGRIDEIAHADGRSRSSMVARMLMVAIDQFESRRDTAAKGSDGPAVTADTIAAAIIKAQRGGK
jgi:predicted transcriptional regulator